MPTPREFLQQTRFGQLMHVDTLRDRLIEAMTPLRAQFEMLERKRGDYSPAGFERTKAAIKQEQKDTIEQTLATYRTDVIGPFLAAAGRGVPPTYPVRAEAMGRATLTLAQIGAMSAGGAALALKDLVARAEGDADDQETRALIQLITPVVMDKARGEGKVAVTDQDEDTNVFYVQSDVDPDPAVTNVLARATRSLEDEQMFRGREAKVMVQEHERGILNLLERFSDTGRLDAEADVQVVTPGIPQPPSGGTKDVHLTQEQAANHKVYEDAGRLAAEQGGTVIVAV